jgi:hypothetical protein
MLPLRNPQRPAVVLTALLKPKRAKSASLPKKPGSPMRLRNVGASNCPRKLKATVSLA